jgi:cyclomaltodextrin glucanotransferase
MRSLATPLCCTMLVLSLAACSRAPQSPPAAAPAAGAQAPSFYGTLEPIAATPVYFVVTDRFVNGDATNDHRDQGGAHPTWDLPLRNEDGSPALGPDGTGDHLGYLGGDFKGVLDHADYIRGMGFGAVWITPIVDNPDQAFTGGQRPTRTSFLTDQGKSGYHGYWGVNFWRLDEHLPSEGLDFRAFTAGLKAHGLDVVLDVVANHGSPAYTMPQVQPGFGQLFDADGQLVADHHNLPPAQLDPEGNPLHAYYRAVPDLAQLSDFDHTRPAVMDYLVGSTLQWLDQGAAALRLDTMKHVPFTAWAEYTQRVRARHPGLFMFGEVFVPEDERDPMGALAKYTLPENGGVSVLDFPQMRAMVRAFGRERAGFDALAPWLALDGGPYANAYALMTFYDNHDVRRLDADDTGFIDAHHWLFTTRGTPVVYYGSEIGFMRGLGEHQGNRNYFGAEGVATARAHPIRVALARIGAVRARSIALQRGLMLPLELAGERAAFYRIYQHDGTSQVALVLLNKGDAPATFRIAEALQPGRWVPQLGGEPVEVADGGAIEATVSMHGAQVFLLDAPVTHPALRERAARLMGARGVAPD